MDSYGNIYPLSNPYVAVVSALAVCGWLIAFIGGCVAALHGVAWWVIIFELVFIVGNIIALGLAGFGAHRGMLLSLLAISIVYLTYIIPVLLDNPDSGARAAVGGTIIMVIMQFFWIVLLGISEESPLYRFFYRGSNISARVPPMIQRNFTNVHPQQDHHKATKESALPPSPNLSNGTNATPNDSTVGEPATALHTYQANEEDPNELSFSKGEVLEILDKKGNWWQAKKQDGQVGIVPSNYFAS